jgi:hypothetical protein
LSTRFSDLTDLALHQQADVSRHLAQGTGEDAAHAQQFSQTIALRMPGSVGKSQTEFVRQRATDHDSLLSERRKRAAGSPELHHQSPANVS